MKHKIFGFLFGIAGALLSIYLNFVLWFIFGIIGKISSEFLFYLLLIITIVAFISPWFYFKHIKIGSVLSIISCVTSIILCSLLCVTTKGDFHWIEVVIFIPSLLMAISSIFGFTYKNKNI